MNQAANSRDDLFLDGTLIGIAGGLAEVAAVSGYSAMSGTDASSVARGIAQVFSVNTMPAVAGLAIHMGLAVALGIALLALMRALPGWSAALGITTFLALSLAAVWGINFFIVLPAVGADFVNLLPYPVSLISKLSFGLAAAAMLAQLRPVGLAHNSGYPGAHQNHSGSSIH
ncbi:putative membrane-bound dolichyl-phosphate-mannose-protein mannosyltransferase [Oxalobacteraceae bacterium GrIS 2.11]